MGQHACGKFVNAPVNGGGPVLLVHPHPPPGLGVREEPVEEGEGVSGRAALLVPREGERPRWWLYPCNRVGSLGVERLGREQSRVRRHHGPAEAGLNGAISVLT